MKHMKQTLTLGRALLLSLQRRGSETIMNKARTLVAAAAVLVLLAALPAWAQQAPAAAADSAAELAKKLANPIANLISVPFQSNWDVGIGSANGSKMVLNIQPVVPFKLSEDWNLITRYIVPVVSSWCSTSRPSAA